MSTTTLPKGTARFAGALRSAVLIAVLIAVTAAVAVDRATGQAPAAAYVAYLPSQVVPFHGIGLAEYATGLTDPVAIANAGDGRLFVVERAGRIRVIAPGGVVLPEPFLDIQDQVRTDFWEQGLLGLAFAPDYGTSGRFYVYYSLDGTADDHPPSRLSRYTVDPANPDKALPDSEDVLLTIPQPEQQHKAGDLHFGPDDYLYVAVGDGGQESAAQNLGELRGSILRLDVSTPAGRPYAIPPNNPYVDVPGAMPEIWVDGLRNPWRFTFDQTGDVYLADVGSDLWEEINVIPRATAGGQNFGWSCNEGFEPRPTIYECRAGDVLTPPIFVYDHSLGRCAVTGGQVYRGSAFPAMQGLYFFGDFCESTIWGMTATGAIAPAAELGNFPALNPSAFGQDMRGEVYVASYYRGTIYRVVPAQSGG